MRVMRARPPLPLRFGLPAPDELEAGAGMGCAYARYLRQYLYFCASKASKLGMGCAYSRYLRQYLYFCTSKASKLGTCECERTIVSGATSAPVHATSAALA